MTTSSTIQTSHRTPMTMPNGANILRLGGNVASTIIREFIKGRNNTLNAVTGVTGTTDQISDVEKYLKKYQIFCVDQENGTFKLNIRN